MRVTPLLSLLTNFADEPPEAFVEVIPPGALDVAPPIAEAEPAPVSPFLRRDEPEPVDVEALVAAARAEERLAAAVETERRLAAQAEELGAAAAAELERERARWVEAEATPIAAGFVEAVATMEHRLCGQLERILEPFLGRAARAACIERFETSVIKMFEACPKGTVRLEGPADLVRAVGARLAAQGVALAAEPAEAIELTALIGDTVIETCLESFAAALGIPSAAITASAKAATAIGEPGPARLPRRSRRRSRASC